VKKKYFGEIFLEKKISANSPKNVFEQNFSIFHFSKRGSDSKNLSDDLTKKSPIKSERGSALCEVLYSFQKRVFDFYRS